MLFLDPKLLAEPELGKIPGFCPPEVLVFGRVKCSGSCSHLQVDLTRSFAFRNSKQMYTGIPIIAANMDTVGTFEMAKVLCKVGFPSCPFLVVFRGLTAEVSASPLPSQVSSGS